MHNARLHDSLRERRGNRPRKPGQAIAAADENVAQPSVAQLGQYRQPELGPLGLGDPAPQGMLAALHIDPDDQVRDLDRHCALVPNLDPDPVDIDNGVHLEAYSGASLVDTCRRGE
jgi:hypothetical protein